jgi:hypothetical protein
MRQTRSSVSPVRQGGFSSQNHHQPRQAGLSPAEKEKQTVSMITQDGDCAKFIN